MYHRLLIIIGFSLLFLLTSLVNFSISEPVFNSPDEASNYQVVREFGLTGNMYLTGEYLDIDYGNNLHPRGFVTHDSKVVPFNFLGVPLVYGTLYSYFGDHIRFLNIILIFIVTIYLYRLAQVFNIIQDKEPGYIIIGILGCIPILYYFNFTYYNIVPFITFVVPFLYYIFRFNNTQKIKYLYIGVLLALMAVWMRYEQVIFITLFMCINMFYNYKTYFIRRKAWLHILLILVFSFIVFLIPLLLLNQQLYGNPLTYGYGLFTKIFFAEERTGGGILQSLINIFFPSQTFDLYTLWINVKNNLFLISPIFFLLGYIGLYKKMLNKPSWLYFLLCVYIILYTGMSATYGSGIDNVDFRGAIGRYWLLIYALLIIPFLIFYKHTNRLTKIVITLSVIVLLIQSNFIKYTLSEINTRKEYIETNNELQKFFIVDKYIIDPMNGKFLYLYNKNISWWGGAVDSNKHYDKTKDLLINTTLYLLNKNEEVYTYSTKRFAKDLHFYDFEKKGIGFHKIKGNLYKLYLKDNETLK